MPGGVHGWGGHVSQGLCMAGGHACRREATIPLFINEKHTIFAVYHW